MTPIDRLIEEDKRKPRRILVVGDGMTDVYIQGRMEECQDGCSKFVEEIRVQCPGGAANATRSIHCWFVRVLCMYNQLSCPVKTRFMVGNKCILRHDNDHYNADLESLRADALLMLTQWHPEGVLISDYDKGLLTPEFIREVIDYCTKHGIPCVADVKREPSLYKGAILKCNEVYQQKYNRELSDLVYDADIGPSLVVTTGPLNPGVWDKGVIQRGFKFLPPVECVNHVGAGDCFAAHLILALTCGLSLKEAAEIAHSAGRVYVQHRYNNPPNPNKIKADMTT